ncbi:transposase [Bradyrhizobium canariense]|uniref:IS66 family transposase n=1 Tax=Bradyrhizobium canariense TaxID=255045 RepID=UPI001C680D87|nr:transposase [Bradyrhizobium canariense]MBW5439306.1 transposase [Bradyrhizobium canariense]
MILFEKSGQHQPLERQSDRCARERVDLSLPTLADLVDACTSVLQPLHARMEVYVLGAERLHGDRQCADRSEGQDDQGTYLAYARDGRPFSLRMPLAALYYASRDRRHEDPVRHPAGGCLHGYNELYDPLRPE